MRVDPFTVLGDSRAASVLRRLHAEADRQMPGLLLHYLPRLPAVLLGRKLTFTESDIRGFCADKFIALEPQQAAFTFLCTRSIRARYVVEFGSSFGLSTIWLAAAVRANGWGKVIGTEFVPSKADRARQHIEEAGLGDIVELRVGDAARTLADLDSPVPRAYVASGA